MIFRLVLLCFLASYAQAETIVASKTLPANTILTLDHITLIERQVPGGVDNPFDLVGMETKNAIYAGNPILISDVTTPAIIERNQLLTLVFEGSGLSIKTDGRALDRGGIGDRINVMNLSSRTTVVATLGPDGAAYVRASE